jgi:Anti-sigma factor NepR
MSKGTRLLERVERWLRPADQLDYMIRRTVIQSAREPLRGVSRSRAERLRCGTADRLREVQEAIGRCLRAQYDLAQPIPARLVELLRQLDNETASPEGTTRDGYASRA